MRGASGLKRAPAAAFLAFALALAGASLAAPADDLREAQRLYGQGKIGAADEKLQPLLAAQPKDPQIRFLHGLLLIEEKRTQDAIQAFLSLNEDFPELPEPYNNLAVLYASQGQYEKAKSLLELAIQAAPSYTIAHENLGDIYAQLAARAYEKALALDKNNAAVAAKVAKMKDVVAPQRLSTTTNPKP